jgi:hypothetical protein
MALGENDSPEKRSPTMNPQAEKILRLALDTAATDGEAESAAVMLIRNWRASGVTAEDILGQTTSARLPAKVMPFGQYKGASIAAIEREDPEYLQWVLATCTRRRQGLRRAIEAALAAC